MVEWNFSKTWVCFLLLAGGLVSSIAGCVDANVDVPDYYKDRDRRAYKKDRDDHWKDRDRDHRRDDRYDDRDRDRDHRKDRDRDDRYRGKLDKDEAYDIAKEFVESRGMEADHFKIRDKKIYGAYWILFEHKRDKHKNRHRRYDFLAVRVARGNRGKRHVTLYMDGDERNFGRRMDKDKVKKKEAYRFAERMAERHGASLRNYEIKDKEIDDNYWILFEDKAPRGRSWKNHFTVRVSKRGIATFYR